jgi:plasmid stabilization system protein ParE
MIVFSPDAVEDARRLYEFLRPENLPAAARAMAAIWNKLELVEKMPGLGYRTKSPSIRQLRVQFGKRRYIVRYTVRAGDAALIVLRIWHGREARR